MNYFQKKTFFKGILSIRLIYKKFSHLKNPTLYTVFEKPNTVLKLDLF